MMESCTAGSQQGSASHRFPRPFMGLVLLPQPGHVASSCAQTGCRHDAPLWVPSCITAQRRVACLSDRREDTSAPWREIPRESNTGQGSKEVGRDCAKAAKSILYGHHCV